MSENLTPEVREDLTAKAMARSGNLGLSGGYALLPADWLMLPAGQVLSLLTALEEARRQIAEQRGVLEWIANHRNDGLTDGSAATRTCLDEIVNLAAAALQASPPSGVSETFSPEAKRQAWSLLEQAVEGLAPTNNGGGDE